MCLSFDSAAIRCNAGCQLSRVIEFVMFGFCCCYYDSRYASHTLELYTMRIYIVWSKTIADHEPTRCVVLMAKAAWHIDIAEIFRQLKNHFRCNCGVFVSEPLEMPKMHRIVIAQKNPSKYPEFSNQQITENAICSVSTNKLIDWTNITWDPTTLLYGWRHIQAIKFNDSSHHSRSTYII